jgi:hypothetical protein
MCTEHFYNSKSIIIFKALALITAANTTLIWSRKFLIAVHNEHR